ncbi:hypothetical protein SteCoe_31275 [Stentor coeruleus]|uniref:Tubulin/FtsZ GTPase domain-containing protein n=1 Tax=Stentor coeruleus TaxID=5963 RepID=A0A1R2B1R6_9CILI|nr:hypothetical protein SteCoe_31275 [Stentor coeruleus]
MREVISLQIGECGDTLANAFWDNLYLEHNISTKKPLVNLINHNEYPEVFLRETTSNNYIPRTIIIDSNKQLEPKYANHIFGNSDSEGNWGKANREFGPSIKLLFKETIRKEAERADCLQGFQIFHSVGGGTGSGITSYLLPIIKDIYEKRLINTFSVLPSENLSQIPSESYNACLTINSLVEYAEIVTLFDNHTLYKMCQLELGISQPYFSDLNSLINPLISAFSCINRYKGNHLTSYKKLLTDCIPFPRLHFFVPLFYPFASSLRKVPENEIIENIVKNTEYFIKNDNYLSTFGGFLLSRGEVSESSIKNEILKEENIRKMRLCEWIPDSFAYENYSVSYKDMKNYCAFFSSNAMSSEIFKRISEKFTYYFRKKTWVDKYLAFGMDEMEFTEAESNSNDLVSEYYPCCMCCEEDDYYYKVEEEGEEGENKVREEKNFCEYEEEEEEEPENYYNQLNND